MKTLAAVAVLAGFMTLPAAASPSPFQDEWAIRSGTPVLLQMAQNQTRAINEQRGGNYGKKKNKKKKKK